LKMEKRGFEMSKRNQAFEKMRKDFLMNNNI